MAYYTTIAYEATLFQETALSICKDVIHLQTKAQSTFISLSAESKTILEDLKNEKSDMTNVIKEISKKSGTFAVQTKELHDEAANHRERVREVLKQVFSNKDAQNKEISSINSQVQSLHVQKAGIESAKQNAQRLSQESKQRAEQAKNDADHERKKKKKKCRGLLGKVKCTLAKAVNINLVKKHEKREKSYRDEERKHLNEVRAQENNYRKAEADLNQVITKLNELQKQIGSLEETANGLQRLIDEYNFVTVAFQDSHRYWVDTSGRLQDLQKEQLMLPSVQDQLYAQWLQLQKESQLYLDLAKNLPGPLPSKLAAGEARHKMHLIKDEL